MTVVTLGAPGVSNRALRPLLGAGVIVRTFAATWRGTLLSCVKDSAWFVVNDARVAAPMWLGSSAQERVPSRGW